MQEDIRPNPLTPIWEFLSQVDQCARRIWGELVGEPIPFGTFLQRNQTYKSICDGFSERFNLLFVTALDYRHQMDLHVMQQSSDALDEKKDALFGCMEFILSQVEETYAAEVLAAFDAFKQKHGNDKPVHAPLEFQGLLDAFLTVVEREREKSPPPPPQEQPNLLITNSFLDYLGRTSQPRSLLLITFSALFRPEEDIAGLSELMRFLEEDSEPFLQKGASIQPPFEIVLNEGVLEEKRDEYLSSQTLGNIGGGGSLSLKEALRAAYAVYLGELLSRPAPDR